MLIYYIIYIYPLKYETYRLYKILIYPHFVFVFHTQYDHGAQFCLEYNHDLYQKYEFIVSAQPSVIIFIAYTPGNVCNIIYH